MRLEESLTPEILLNKLAVASPRTEKMETAKIIIKTLKKLWVI